MVMVSLTFYAHQRHTRFMILNGGSNTYRDVNTRHAFLFILSITCLEDFTLNLGLGMLKKFQSSHVSFRDYREISRSSTVAKRNF